MGHTCESRELGEEGGARVEWKREGGVEPKKTKKRRKKKRTAGLTGDN